MKKKILTDELDKLKSEITKEEKRMEMLNDRFKDFTGSGNTYKTIMPSIIYTDGVKQAAEELKAYWTIDLIVSYQIDSRIKGQRFQVWDFIAKESSVTIKVTDGNENILLEKLVPFTTLPNGILRLYFTNRTILLPSEY